jgi:hypothetical protein
MFSHFDYKSLNDVEQSRHAVEKPPITPDGSTILENYFLDKDISQVFTRSGTNGPELKEQQQQLGRSFPLSNLEGAVPSAPLKHCENSINNNLAKQGLFGVKAPPPVRPVVQIQKTTAVSFSFSASHIGRANKAMPVPDLAVANWRCLPELPFPRLFTRAELRDKIRKEQLKEKSEAMLSLNCK